MKYILILIVIASCTNEPRPVEIVNVDSLTKLVNTEISNRLINDSMEVERIRETWKTAWWRGANAAQNHPNTLEIAFLADSLRFNSMVDRIFHKK